MKRSRILSGLETSPSIEVCSLKQIPSKTIASLKSSHFASPIDIVTEIPVFYRITNADVHDVNSMDGFTYKSLAAMCLTEGALTFRDSLSFSGAFFIIREKGLPKYEITVGEDYHEGCDNIIRDQMVCFSGKNNQDRYPTEPRRVVYYAHELQRTFTCYTNSFYLDAKDIALLYRYRWQIELFFE